MISYHIKTKNGNEIKRFPTYHSFGKQMWTLLFETHFFILKIFLSYFKFIYLN